MKKTHAAEFAILFSCAVFAFMSLAVKYVSAFYSGVFISWIRFTVGLVLVGVTLFLAERPFKIVDYKAWILRGVFGSLSMVACYWAIQLTSSGRAVLLTNTYPIFVVLYGALFFKERITKTSIVAVITCFLGVLFVFYDRSHYSFVGNGLALLSGIFGGFAVHFMKRARMSNSAISVYLSACIFGFIFSVPAAMKPPIGIYPRLIWILLGIGVLAFIGQIIMTTAYKYLTASRGSIIGFSETIFTIVFSYLWLGEEIKSRFIFGTCLIVLGLLINQNLVNSFAGNHSIKID